jgi:hypothetical protein
MTMPSRFAEHFFAQREALEVKGTQVSVGAVIKTFVKIGVRIGRTGTEGRFFRKG